MKKILILLTAALLLLTSCGKEKAEAAKPISQIQEENGIPVRVTAVVKSNLSAWKDYSGVLEGKEQMVMYGMLGDELKKIHVKIGDRVKKDQVLAEYSNENPQAQNRQAQIGFETIEKTYNRVKTIYQSGGVSKQQLDEVEAQYKVAKENLSASGKLLVIKSPIDGVVTDKFVDIGQIIDSKTPVFKIAKIDQLKALIFIDEAQINSYHPGQSAKIVWESDKKNEFSGKIEKISLSAIPERRGFQAEISIDDPAKILKPGMFVTVNLEVSRLSNVLHVNRTALREEGGKTFVFVAANGKAVKKEITLGRDTGFDVEILSGLAEGDLLITDGQNMVSDGSRVKEIK